MTVGSFPPRQQFFPPSFPFPHACGGKCGFPHHLCRTCNFLCCSKCSIGLRGAETFQQQPFPNNRTCGKFRKAPMFWCGRSSICSMRAKRKSPQLSSSFFLESVQANRTYRERGKSVWRSTTTTSIAGKRRRRSFCLEEALSLHHNFQGKEEREAEAEEGEGVCLSTLLLLRSLTVSLLPTAIIM